MTDGGSGRPIAASQQGQRQTAMRRVADERVEVGAKADFRLDDRMC